MASLQHENQKIRHMCEKASAERDDAVTKFEESARASGELLKEMDQADDRNKQSHQEVLREMEVTKQVSGGKGRAPTCVRPTDGVLCRC